MFDIDFTFLFTALNLLILYFVIKKFLWGRLGGFINERSKAIADDIERGETMKLEGERYQKEQEELFSGAYEEKKKILEEAKKQASKEYDAAVKRAKEDADRILAEARAEAQREKERLLKELRREVATLAVAAATKIIKENMDNDKNRGLVDDFLSGGGAA